MGITRLSKYITLYPRLNGRATGRIIYRVNPDSLHHDTVLSYIWLFNRISCPGIYSLFPTGSVYCGDDLFNHGGVGQLK